VVVTLTVTIKRAEWDAMSPAQRRARVEDAADQYVVDQGGYGRLIDDEADAASVGQPGPDPLRGFVEWLASQVPPVATTPASASAHLRKAILRAREALGGAS
jgi:hypothetical protein